MFKKIGKVLGALSKCEKLELVGNVFELVGTIGAIIGVIVIPCKALEEHNNKEEN